MSRHSAPGDTFTELPHAWTGVSSAQSTDLPAEEQEAWLTSAVASLEYAGAAGYDCQDLAGRERVIIALRDSSERVWGVYDFSMSGVRS